MAADEKTQEQGSPEQIEAEIEATREELGDTVAALADKSDVKKQAKRKVDEAKAKALAKSNELKQAAQAKREEVVGKVSDIAQNPPQDAAAQAAQGTVDQAVQAARENPVPAAAAGGLATGILVGWILGRR